MSGDLTHDFPEPEKHGLYRAIYERRDIRKEFLPQPVPLDILMKLLDAAHHAGSVGFMQPWNFIVVRDPKIKARVKTLFETANEKAAANYTGARKEKYQSMKLEGIMDAPLNICVTCDSSRNGPHVLGRDTIPDTDLFSTCCAVQNLWLAARAEGIGMGWVSILEPEELKNILEIPAEIRVVAYLCLGYVTDFPHTPMLEKEGWEKRLPLDRVIYWDKWDSGKEKK